MLSLKDQAEINRIGLVTGLLTKNDVINWADKIIESEETIDYEIIEVSLLQSYPNESIASKLFEVKGISSDENNINTFLGLCSNAYIKKKFTAYEMCDILYRLVSSQINLHISSHIEQKIHYLSDGYYLASEGTYGDLNEICMDLHLFLNKYAKYANTFNSLFL
ncbi:hypothetical protein [Clostridium sp. C8-1-8]|uniref:hypothetical protein n=1 Tax=Clostridium sp. C8-1-8 TaxID=2698831 RepID=UPI0013722C32|nr:hypothetical protein [Clostridium sp. C8-1-8]